MSTKRLYLYLVWPCLILHLSKSRVLWYTRKLTHHYFKQRENIWLLLNKLLNVKSLVCSVKCTLFLLGSLQTLQCLQWLYVIFRNRRSAQVTSFGIGKTLAWFHGMIYWRVKHLTFWGYSNIHKLVIIFNTKMEVFSNSVIIVKFEFCLCILLGTVLCGYLVTWSR